MKYYVYDGEGDDIVDSLEEAIEALNVGIEYSREDGEWADWVDMMHVREEDAEGKLVARVKQVGLVNRPAHLDDDLYDEEGTFWGDFDVMCDYEVEVLVS